MDLPDRLSREEAYEFQMEANGNKHQQEQFAKMRETFNGGMHQMQNDEESEGTEIAEGEMEIEEYYEVNKAMLL